MTTTIASTSEPAASESWPDYDTDEALVTESYYYMPRRHSALWDVFAVEATCAVHVGTHRPIRDHRNVVGPEREVVKRVAAVDAATALKLKDPWLPPRRELDAQARVLSRSAGRVVQRDCGGSPHQRKRQYRGWTNFDGYIVTDPDADDVVDVYEERTWRMLGSYELPSSLCVWTAGLHGFHYALTDRGVYSFDARVERWHAAVKALRLYSDSHARELRSQLHREALAPCVVDAAQLELDFEPNPEARPC